MVTDLFSLSPRFTISMFVKTENINSIYEGIYIYEGSVFHEFPGKGLLREDTWRFFTEKNA